MATIGSFTRTDDGYTGFIRTLTLSSKVQFQRVDATSEKAPDYRIHAGQAEIGAGWTKTSEAGRRYVSVKLDDPSFPAPVFASLVEQDNGYALIWSRS